MTEKKQTLDPSINETFAGRWSFFRKFAAARAWCHVKTSVFSLWYSSKKLVAALVGILARGVEMVEKEIDLLWQMQREIGFRSSARSASTYERNFISLENAKAKERNPPFSFKKIKRKVERCWEEKKQAFVPVLEFCQT